MIVQHTSKHIHISWSTNNNGVTEKKTIQRESTRASKWSNWMSEWVMGFIAISLYGNKLMGKFIEQINLFFFLYTITTIITVLIIISCD